MQTSEGDALRDPAPPAGVAALRARATEALRFHPREAVALAVLAALVVTGATIGWARGRTPPAAAALPATDVVESPAPSARPEIVVHVVGAVRTPGVYRFSSGARVLDAVEAAGGLARDAEPARLNMARPLVDGEQVVVPRKGEVPPVVSASGAHGGAQGAGGKLNINLASETELQSLPGIGPVLAKRIVDYRAAHGPFRSVRDLLKVQGIGQKKFESLEPQVTV